MVSPFKLLLVIALICSFPACQKREDPLGVRYRVDVQSPDNTIDNYPVDLTVSDLWNVDSMRFRFQRFDEDVVWFQNTSHLGNDTLMLRLPLDFYPTKTGYWIKLEQLMLFMNKVAGTKLKGRLKPISRCFYRPSGADSFDIFFDNVSLENVPRLPVPVTGQIAARLRMPNRK